MNLTHLKYAIVVLETGSISKAAEKLFVAQPNISRAIKELETQLDIVIFDRNNKGISVTPDGERLLTYGKKILGEVDELELSFKNKEVNKQLFSICAPRVSYIAKAFVDFTNGLDKDLQYDFYYRETNAYRALHNVTNNLTNLGIVRYNENYDKYFKEMFEKKEIHYELINSFNYVLVFSKDSVLAKKETINFEDLDNLIEIAHADPFVPSLPVHELLRGEVTSNTKRKIYVYERASQYELLQNNPETYMWVSPCPKGLLENFGGLIQRRSPQATKVYKDMLIYRKDYHLTKLDKDFINYLCESKRKAMSLID